MADAVKLPDVALSLRQPWAWLVVNGHKDVENRVWHRANLGTFLVHASKGMTYREYEDVLAFLDCIEHYTTPLPDFDALERGGIVGVATHTGEVLPPSGSDRDWHMDGQFGYVLRDCRTLPFVPCSGRLGLWRVPPEVMDALARG